MFKPPTPQQKRIKDIEQQIKANEAANERFEEIKRIEEDEVKSQIQFL